MKHFLFFVILSIAANMSFAQAPFLTRDSVDANLLNTSVLVHGDMWWRGTSPGHGCFYPKASGKTVSFAGALWMSAHDNSGQLHVAAQTYRQDGNDYWPGPLDDNDTVTYATSTKWAKIWKVRKSDIDAYNAISTHTTANTPLPILTWPAKGNAHAAGYSSAPLTITEDMAPFVDKNGNGIYEPLSGDHPDIYNSEQALWWCFSDNGATHNADRTTMKVQVHAMAYAYKRNTLIDQVVYYDYTIVNKSANDYGDMRVALWNDVEIGYFLDDYIGFDSTWRMGIVYNGTEDDGLTAGHPANSHGLNAPASAVTMVVAPGDAAGAPQPLGSYMYYQNDASPHGNPYVDTHYNYYMHARTRAGAHLQHGGVDRNYAYPDDPTTIGGWNECVMANVPGERRTILASGDFALAAGQRKKMVVALLVDTVFGGCPSIASFDTLRQIADTAWGNYHASHVGVPKITSTADGHLKVYPNPAGNVLHIDAGKGAKHISIHNIVGQRLYDADCDQLLCSTDISQYPPGVYVLQCYIDGQMMHTTFRKQ